MNLKFRSGGIEDSKWITETLNTPEVAKYLIMLYPLTEHEVKEELKEAVKDEDRKFIVAELDDAPVGGVGVRPGKGRTRHIAWLGIYVRRDYWGRGIGTALMEQAIRVARDYGCRRLMLGTYEGNERALNLYRRMGFKTESFLTEKAYIEGEWHGSIIMGLDLAGLEPRISQPPEIKIEEKPENLTVREFVDHDLNEINRLQNCLESTKSSSRIPPISKEKTKEWYESLSRLKNRYCFGCFKEQKLLGYIRYSTSPPPFTNVRIEEFIVDVNENPAASANALVLALLDFQKRYAYRKTVGSVPLTSAVLMAAFEKHGFKKVGTWKGYYFIDGHYVDAVSYAYS